VKTARLFTLVIVAFIAATNAFAQQNAQKIDGLMKQYKEAKIDSSIFDSYVGEYQVTPALVLTISKEGDKLFAQMTGQGKLAIEAVSETQFTIPEVKANNSIEKDSAGNVVGLLLSQGTRTANARKIK